jgi:hypothetical protein
LDDSAASKKQRIKAFILLDMTGDKDLDIQRYSNSTGWLSEKKAS